jgi:NitT/TauT family transport system ATP-binding protein
MTGTALAAPAVEFRSVGLAYLSPEGETPALADVSLGVEPGEFVSVVGPSGCGKSTLLSLLSGILTPSHGEVLVFGQPVQGPSPRVGYMLQHDHLFPWRTVLENVLIGPEVLGRDLRAARERGLALLERYGLGEFAGHFPGQLSGGMRQRVALVRTLAVDPDLLLLDEPFSALDFQTRLALADEVWRILRQAGKTAVLVTHDIGEAIAMSDRILVLSRRPARVKSAYVITLAAPRTSPFAVRATREFNEYFRVIWEDLDVHLDH